jgi:hypothetical protein
MTVNCDYEMNVEESCFGQVQYSGVRRSADTPDPLTEVAGVRNSGQPAPILPKDFPKFLLFQTRQNPKKKTNTEKASGILHENELCKIYF